MKVLVTGATGFIGSHLVKRLTQNRVAVRCLVRQGSDLSFLKTFRGIKIIKGDLLDPSSFEEATKGVEKVFHLAAISQTIDDVDYSYFEKHNVLPTIHLAKAAIKNRVKKFIFYSSIEAVGLKKAANIKTPIDESVLPAPETKYGRSKLEAEKALMHLYQIEGLPVTIIRPTVIYGPRDTIHGPLKLFKSIQSGMFKIAGSGQNLVSWCYVGNLVEATLLVAAKKVSTGQTYFINDESPYPFEEIAQTVAQCLGKKVSQVKIPLFLAKLACWPIEFGFSLAGQEPPLSKNKLRLTTQDFVYNLSKAKKQLGYRQIYSLRQGIKTTIAWYKKHGYL